VELSDAILAKAVWAYNKEVDAIPDAVFCFVFKIEFKGG
jgi:hypothetical protein